MADEKSTVQEFKLDSDCELRFEVESKNEKVTLEVSNVKFLYLKIILIFHFSYKKKLKAKYIIE